MLVTREGRTVSVRTASELDESLKKEMSTLSPEEREALRIILQDFHLPTPTGSAATQFTPAQPNLLAALSAAEYKTLPVDMRTFIKDPEFLGNTCDSLYPKFLDDLVDLFSGGYNECIITGAIGIGKTFVCTIGIARVLYEISCLKDPHKTFGLAKDTNITLACFSVNEELATKVVFENIKTKITASPYFMRNFPFSATKKELRFPHNVWVAPRATTDTSALGLNVISAFMDEGNFLPKRGKYAAAAGIVDHADLIYSSLKRRMKSRFEKAGKLPGILFIASSKTTHEDFVSRRLKEARDDPTLFVRDYALWEIKPEDYYSVDKFQVLVGNETIPSKILDPGEADHIRPLLPDGTIIINVPEDFKIDFERDLEGSIKDIAGCSVVSVSPFIQRREKLQDAIEQDKKTYGADRHFFSKPEYDPAKGGQFVWEKAVRLTADPSTRGQPDRLRPIINPNAMRHIHIDIGVKHDALGFCMAHIGSFKDVVRRGANGEQHLERAPVFVVDLMLRVTPPPGDEIILGDVRRLVYELAQHGFTITSVTTDSYQCLAKGTLVDTSRGIVPIESVREGDFVQSRVGPKPVEKVWSFGEQDTLRIITAAGDILEGTAKHRIEVQRGWLPFAKTRFGTTREPLWEWVRLDEIAVGDTVHMRDDPVQVEPSEGAPLHGDPTTLGRGYQNQKGMLDLFDPPARMTSPLAEFLGLIWGDGSITEDGVRLTVTEDEYADAAAVTQRALGVRPAFHPYKDRNCGYLGVSARWFVRWLDENALCKPLIPQAILCSGKDILAAFLRGLFATDGSVSKSNGGVSLSTKHKDLAKQVRLILRTQFGIPSCMTTIPRGHAGDYVSEGEQYVVSVSGSRQTFLDAVGFSYSRKQQRLAEHRLVRGRRLHVKVASIERSRAEVFDLQIADDPSYTANGFVSHNSTDMVQQLNQKGFNAKIVSVDTSTEPYETLKTAYYEDRVFVYEHATLQTELRQLQRDYRRRKIDHPSRGSKDCADALAGVLWTLSQQQLTTPLPILRQSATGGDSWMTDQYQGQAGGGSSGAEKWEPLPFFRGSNTGGRG